MTCTANTAAIVKLLSDELVIAESRYENRRFDADHKALRLAKVQARLRFRSFFLSAARECGLVFLK